MYERNAALQINRDTPHCAKPLLPAAILFRGRPCPVNEELKSLSDEGRTCAWACTLFCFCCDWLRGGAKANVSANAWLLEGLIYHSAGVKILGADVGILNADGSFLGAYYNFLFAIVRFLKSGSNSLIAEKKSLDTVGTFIKAEGSFLLADENSLCDVVNFLKSAVSLLFLGAFKLQFADLFVLRACRPEN